MKKNFINRLIFSFLITPIIFFILFIGNVYFYILLLLIFFGATFETLKIKDNISRILILIILFFFIYSCLEIHKLNNSFFYLSLILIVAILSDTGGYIFGKLFKGKKIKYISPNKTYFGFLGSILFAQLSIFFMIYHKYYIYNSLILNLVLLLGSSFIVIFGDLFFSFIKRKNGIKDYSNLLPGHGGILDRIDGLVFLTIFYFLFIIKL